MALIAGVTSIYFDPSIGLATFAFLIWNQEKSEDLNDAVRRGRFFRYLVWLVLIIILILLVIPNLDSNSREMAVILTAAFGITLGLASIRHSVRLFRRTTQPTQQYLPG